MATLIVAPAAIEDLAKLIESHSLPAETRTRVRRIVEALAVFPRLGPPLEGRWAGFRFVLGPWRWMLVVYVYDEAADLVIITTVQDARSARAATAGR